jgi:hypothetical protein
MRQKGVETPRRALCVNRKANKQNLPPRSRYELHDAEHRQTLGLAFREGDSFTNPIAPHMRERARAETWILLISAPPLGERRWIGVRYVDASAHNSDDSHHLVSSLKVGQRRRVFHTFHL